MPRAKKDTEALHCNLDVNVSRDLTEFCMITGLSKTVAVEKAVKLFIEHYRTTGKL